MRKICINKVILKGCCSGSRCVNKVEVLSRNTSGRQSGFTLVELLVVALIIGILSAIAIPMYQGAVDKSRWSTLLTPAKALQTAQAAAHLETGAYAEVADALVVSLPGEAEDNKYVMPDAQYSLQTKNDNQSTITGELTALPNVRLSMFLKHPDNYLFCDAKTGDARAERLCNKLLGGTKASTKDGYTKYILDYPGTCAWANTTGQCYTSEEARCTAMGMPYSDGMCGYKNVGDNEGRNLVINEGGVCESDDGYSCRYITVNEGGTCKATKANYAACYMITVKEGGVCISATNPNSTSCYNMVKNEGTCIANGPMSCTGTYSGKGCCEDYGKGFCPSNVPKC